MSYPGGKGASGVAQTIINQQPPHDIYIEAFAGGAAVFRAKRPARMDIALDLDASAVAQIRTRLRPGQHVYQCDALVWLAHEHLGPDTLVYCDPPYPMESRSRRRKLYACEFTDAEHLRLLRILQKLPCMVQLSTYANTLYSSHLQNWRCIEFKGMTRGGLRTEQLWMNYPPPAALHTYTLLGADYRERERIKRKTDRMMRRLRALPPLERLALCSATAEFTAAAQAGLPGCTASPGGTGLHR